MIKPTKQSKQQEELSILKKLQDEALKDKGLSIKKQVKNHIAQNLADKGRSVLEPKNQECQTKKEKCDADFMFYDELVTEDYIDALVKEIKGECKRRADERRSLELQWQLNMNFHAGRQYAEISPLMKIDEQLKQYEWQSREVFNHIAPIIETRCAKLSRVRPKMSVRAGGDEESDIYAAKFSSKILNSCYSGLNLDTTIASATMWSEVCGTAFYKAVWDSKGGRAVGKDKNGEKIYDGDVAVTVCPPFEIFPHNLFTEGLEHQKSIIHAKACHVDEIENVWGQIVSAENLDVFSFNAEGKGNPLTKSASSVLKDFALVIEYYEKPTKKYPEGRLAIVAGEKLLSLTKLPSFNSFEGVRGFPFIKQSSIHSSGNFFGISIIERCIPIQRAYNAVKNRKHEFLNRISSGVIAVEDGSTDTDLLEEEGLAPGRVIVYRQGSSPPVMMDSGRVPLDFTYEEERLMQEFKMISGVSDVMRNSDTQSNLTSGVAISLLIEQDDTRLSISAEMIRRAVKSLGKHILRLYKQYAASPRLLSIAGENNAIEHHYFSSKDITADDVVLDTENELSQSPAQKKSMILDMLKAGLLNDQNGRLSMRMKARVADLLGFSDFENGQDLINLNIKRAAKENLLLIAESLQPLEIDDHELHITEHIKYMLSGEFELSKNQNKQENFMSHIQKHKTMLALTEQTMTDNQKEEDGF